ncbi:hypothetical protein LZ31DRAFT_373410 [Colletotrichum somersetense]|nr:hypothetical protein LZ31DRAFT_373410 [Colletotrichum somersetense]
MQPQRPTTTHVTFAVPFQYASWHCCQGTNRIRAPTAVLASLLPAGRLLFRRYSTS